MAETKTGRSKVLPCSCTHPAQDKIYGRFLRLHNWGPKVSSQKGAGYRCTVCGKERGE